MRGTVQDFKNAVIRFMSSTTPALTKLMGIALIFNAALSIYADYRNLGHVDVVTVLVTISILIPATLILIDFSFNLNRAMGLYAMSLGVSRIFRYGSNLGEGTGVGFIYSLVMFGFAINMCVTAYTYLVNSVRGRFGMMFNGSVTIFMTVCGILYPILEYDYTIQDIFFSRPDSFSAIILYIILLLMLTSAPIRMNTKGEKNVRTLNHIRLTHTCSPKSRIIQKDADVLAKAFTDRSDWTGIHKGPVDCEYKFRIVHKVDDYTYVTVQKWNDSNDLYFTLSDHLTGSLTDAYRFKVDTIYMETEGHRFPTLVLQNSDGLFMRLNVWFAEDRV